MRITTTTNGDIAIIIPRKEFEQLFTQRDLFDSPQIDLKGLHKKTIGFLKDVYSIKGKSEWIADERAILELRQKHFVLDINNGLKSAIDKGIVNANKEGSRHKYKLNYELK